MVKVSVIIPAYNVEKYIKECIGSFLNQTFSDFELILVDDGSKDKTLETIKTFNDNRIFVYSIENSGAGQARNFGLNKAKGKWVVFFDGDDFCNKTFLEKMVSKAEGTDCDIVICASAEYIEKKKKITRHRKAHTLEWADEKFLNFTGDLHRINGIGKNPLMEFVEPWNKIYKKDFLLSNNIKFPKILCAEDTPFSYEALVKAGKISFVKDELVYIRRRPKSLSFSTNKNWINYFYAYELADDIVFGYKYFDEIKETYFERKINTYRYFYKKAGVLNKIPYFLKFLAEIKKTNKILKSNRYSILKALI